ncbi:MAG: HD domain-containing phosphohydrolase [Candidatus Aminicenantaceae bacterium]
MTKIMEKSSKKRKQMKNTNNKSIPEKKLKILMLEDEPTDSELIERELKKANIDFTSRYVDTKKRFVDEINNFKPNLILADYQLPTFDGLSALKLLRKNQPSLPFIFVSGKMGEEFAIETLKQGATDYVLKNRMSRLAPAVRRALREAENQKKRKQAEVELKASYHRLSKVFEETVKALAFALEKRDPYTAGHQRRVAQLATAISKNMNYKKFQIEGIKLAATLHDIGKINVPSEILNKPGPINEIERALINVHPQVGYDILKVIEFPWPIATIVHQHHERLDGSGYPKGLLGKNIHHGAKLLAVADVVEAMASPRPYRSALGIKKALKEISLNKNKLYDAKIVDACIKLFEKGFKF